MLGIIEGAISVISNVGFAPKITGSILVCAKLFVVATLIAALQAGANAQTTSQKKQSDMIVHNSPDEGGPRRFQVAGSSELRIYDAPSTGSIAVGVVPEGAILSNLGCMLVDDHVWCHAQLFREKTRGFVSGEFLIPAAGPDGIIPMGADDSSRRARKGNFDAREHIPCAQVRGQAMGVCSAQVARGGGGDAAVVVTFSNGFKRTLYFAHGVFISANATMSGIGTDTDWSKRDELHFIRVEDQRYEIPDVLIVDKSSDSE